MQQAPLIEAENSARHRFPGCNPKTVLLHVLWMTKLQFARHRYIRTLSPVGFCGTWGIHSSRL